MKKQSSTRSRFWLPLIVLALGVALALGGCARNGPATSGGTAPSSQTTPTGAGQTGTTGSASGDLNALQQLDQQTQNDVNGLSTDQNNVNQNSGGETETQP